MSSVWPDVSEPQLEEALRDLGPHLNYPPSEHVAFAVHERLSQAPAPARSRAVGALPRLLPRWRDLGRPVFVPAWQRAAVALAVLVAIFSGILTFSPSARQAVAGWLGLRGVKIEVTPSLSPVPLGRNLVLGPSVSLQDAQAAVPFRILLPSAPGLGSPDEVDLTKSFATGRVGLLYRARPGLPVATQTGVALIVTEFEAKPDRLFIEKKLVASGTPLESVRVNGAPGFWIEGVHELFYIGPDGEPIRDTARIVGNVLLWQHGSVTLRIEADIAKDQALRIAESVH